VGPRYVELAIEFVKVYREYAGVLHGRIKTPDISPEGCCLILNTSYSCRDAVDSLATIKLNVPNSAQIFLPSSSPEFMKELHEVSDLLLKVSHESVAAICSALLPQFQPAFGKMQALNWAPGEDKAGDDSVYVDQFSEALRKNVPPIEKLLHADFHPSFQLTLSTTLMDKYRSTLSLISHVNEKGARLLLSDFGKLKSCVLEMPTMGESGVSANVLKSRQNVFRLHVASHAERIQKILGVLAAPGDLKENLKKFQVQADDFSLVNKLNKKPLLFK